MNGQCQIPTGSNARVGGYTTGSCMCSSKNRNLNAGKFESAKSNFPSSEVSNKNTTPYDDWSVLDDEQNTFSALRRKAHDFIAPQPEEFQVNTLPRHCGCGREPLYACPNVLKKANDMIDYVPESEFLKKMKQQCQLLEYNQPNIFSAINDYVLNDTEGFIEQPPKRLRDPLGCRGQCKTAAFRQNNVPHNFNETYNVPRNFNEKYNVPRNFNETYNVPRNFNETYNVPRNFNEAYNGQCNMDEAYIEGENQAYSSDENIIQSRNAQERKSEHVSRSKKPHKCRGRRKRKSGSGEADECTAGDVFAPTLKRPHEDSCERCWRYASPARSPVNKPEQRYDPNFRRGHSCHNFERGDADLVVSDRHISPCRNLQALPSRGKIFTPPYHLRTPSPIVSEEIAPSNFQNLQRAPFVQSNREGVSIWQKPSTAPAASERVFHRTPLPYPHIQQRMSEMYPPYLPVQQEYLANQAEYSENKLRQSNMQHKGAQTLSQAVRQQKPQVQFKSPLNPRVISFYDSPDSSPERGILTSPMYDSPVDINCPIIYSDQRQNRPRGTRIMPQTLTDIPAEAFQGSNVTQYRSLPNQPDNQEFVACPPESVPPVLARQVSPARTGPTGLTAIPEAADSDSNKTKRSGSPKQVKSTKNASRQNVGSHPGSSGSHRGSSGSNVGSSPVKTPSPNKSGSPKKGKPKTPSPRPCADRSPKGSEKSPKKSPPKQMPPEVAEIAQPRSPERRPQSPAPQRSPVKTAVQEAAGAPAVQHQYEVPDHTFVRCSCKPSPTDSPEDHNSGHLICCHCKWQERAKDTQNPRCNGSGAGRMSPEKNLEQNPRGYDSVALRCPYLRTSKGEEIGVSPEQFGEAELRLMRQYQGQPFQDISPIPCSPKKYVVMYMTKCKENKADEDVEVLVEELTQACPKTTDSKTKDITEKMKKIMECPSDSMALRFQKGVSESYTLPQSSRTLYF